MLTDNILTIFYNTLLDKLMLKINRFYEIILKNLNFLKIVDIKYLFFHVNIVCSK